MSTDRIVYAVLLVILLHPLSSVGQSDRTVGLLQIDETRVSEGYTLFAPNRGTTTYLIDLQGQIVHSWENDRVPGNSVYLLPDGRLLRPVRTGSDRFLAGGRGGRVQMIEPDGSLSWDFEYSSDTVKQHHDVAYLPNGNVLMIAWELRSEEEAIQAGRDPAQIPDGEVWSDTIVEVKPTGATTGQIVWKWDPWHHLIQDVDDSKDNFGVIFEHPELVDINAGSPDADWLHFNAVNYNAELDQIAVSSRTMSEIWVIDHSTTMEEAKTHTGGTYGKGGDLLYRWGNPENYARGDESDQTLWVQHDIQWIEPGLPGAGNMLVFNNGNDRASVSYSSVDEFQPPQSAPGVYSLMDGEAYRPFGPIWSYTATPEEDMWSPFISGATRLPNGNTLICSGAYGRLIEVTVWGDIVWEYINPVVPDNKRLHSNEEIPTIEGLPGTANLLFRAYRYKPDYPGLDGLDLTPRGTVELGPIMDSAIEGEELPSLAHLTSIYPNPASRGATVEFDLERPSQVRIEIVDLLGRTAFEVAEGTTYPGGASRVRISTDQLPAGVYLVRLRTPYGSHSKRLVVSR